MPLLREVRHDKSAGGLVGITESGEEVKLSAPIPKVKLLSKPNIDSSESGVLDNWLNKVVSDIIIPHVGPNVFIQLGQREASPYFTHICVVYNEYTIRE